MTATNTPRARRRFRWVSPATMLGGAIILAAVFGLCHAMGLREDVCVLSATSGGAVGSAIGGLAYALAYLGFVLLSPILMIAAGIFAVVQYTLNRKASARRAQ